MSLKLTKVGQINVSPAGLRKLASAISVIYPSQTVSIPIYTPSEVHDEMDPDRTMLYAQLAKDSGIIHLDTKG